MKNPERFVDAVLPNDEQVVVVLEAGGHLDEHGDGGGPGAGPVDDGRDAVVVDEHVGEEVVAVLARVDAEGAGDENLSVRLLEEETLVLRQVIENTGVVGEAELDVVFSIDEPEVRVVGLLEEGGEGLVEAPGASEARGDEVVVLRQDGGAAGGHRTEGPLLQERVPALDVVGVLVLRVVGLVVECLPGVVVVLVDRLDPGQDGEEEEVDVHAGGGQGGLPGWGTGGLI